MTILFYGKTNDFINSHKKLSDLSQLLWSSAFWDWYFDLPSGGLLNGTLLDGTQLVHLALTGVVLAVSLYQPKTYDVHEWGTKFEKILSEFLKINIRQ